MVVILSNCGEGLMRLKQQKNSIYFGGRTAFYYKYAIEKAACALWHSHRVVVSHRTWRPRTDQSADFQRTGR